MFLFNRGARRAALLSIAFGAASLAANAQQAKFSLPFEAHWGNAVLQPGEYTISAPTPVSGVQVISLAGAEKTVYLLPSTESFQPQVGRELPSDREHRQHARSAGTKLGCERQIFHVRRTEGPSRASGERADGAGEHEAGGAGPELTLTNSGGVVGPMLIGNLRIFSRAILGEAICFMGEKRVIVAIDGPAGAGKSTLARRVADRLGFIYINSGAMYRAIALWGLRLGVELKDMHRLEQLAIAAKIELSAADGRVFLNGEDVSEAIRDLKVSEAASKVSAVPGVRRALLPVQRNVAEQSSVVMDGRDIGSVVFPQAQVKIFLDADPNERARRRALQLQEEGQAADVQAVAGELHKRDERDRKRSEAPLVQAPDAELVDTTGLSLDEVEEIILRLVRARTSNGKEAARGTDASS